MSGRLCRELELVEVHVDNSQLSLLLALMMLLKLESIVLDVVGGECCSFIEVSCICLDFLV